MMARRRQSRHGRRVLVCLALCLVAAQKVEVGTPSEPPGPCKPGMSRDQQIQLGFQAASQVY